MDSSDVLLLVLAAALVPIAGLFAAADAAITTVYPAKVQEQAREGRRGADALLAIVEDRPRYTNLLLLLRVAAELAATVLVAGVVFSTFGFRAWVTLTVVAIMLLVCYVVIGVGPRTLGRQHPYAIGFASAKATRMIARALSPIASFLILLGNAVTPGAGFRKGPFSSEVDLRDLFDMAGSRGDVEESERNMLRGVFDLGDTIVREVMVPRTEVVWIEADKTLRQALHLANRSGMSRIPVVGEDPDDVLGVVYLKDLVAQVLTPDGQGAERTVREGMRPPVFIPESKNVDALLTEMQRDRNHFAVVVDEYGGTAGIVTIEDLLEEIVGEITDEYDQDTPAPLERLDSGEVRVSARLPVEDLGEEFDVELPNGEVETVGGLLAQALGRVPLPGAEVTIRGLHLLGEYGEDRRGHPRVQTVLVRRVEAIDGEPPNGVDGAATERRDGAEPPERHHDHAGVTASTGTARSNGDRNRTARNSARHPGERGR